VESSTVLLISEDPDFLGAVPARWKREARVPAFTAMTGDLCQSFDPEIYDLAIVAKVSAEALQRVVKALQAAAKPLLLVTASTGDIQNLPAHAIVLQEHPGWLDTLILVAAQVLERCEAIQQIRLVEEVHASAEREATLGR
jgi:hypothetical protein